MSCDMPKYTRRGADSAQKKFQRIQSSRFRVKKLQKKMFATKNFLFTKKVFVIDFDWMWVAFK